MIVGMIKIIGLAIELLFKTILFGISLFLTLSLNVLTLPLFTVMSFICKVFHLQTPHFGRYGLMVYPKWSYKPSSSMISDMNTQWNKEQAKIKKPASIRAYEEWFFY